MTGSYAFTVPAGRRFALRFQAWAAGVPTEVEARVILDVVPAEEIGAAQPLGPV
ncbi:MAG: hypothetical protein Kow0097_06540 [Candidatus Bipolaricaulota bacterium]|nr:hypothetical protein [Candidatus Bipolaricaulota bacterium]